MLVAVAGYADAIGFLQFRTFAGQMTGNTILLAISIFGSSWLEVAHYVMVILSFLLAVFISRTLLRLGRAPSFVLTLQAAAIAVCAFVTQAWGALILAFAMGLQNAAATRFGDATLNTVFITGDLQKLFERLVARIWTAPGKASENSRELPTLALIWLEYFCGALLGALAHMVLAHPLLLPAALLPFVLLRSTQPDADFTARR